MSKADLIHTNLAETEARFTARCVSGTYTVYASYSGGPSEAIATGLDRDEAMEQAREQRAEFGWEAWIDAEEGE